MNVLVSLAAPEGPRSTLPGIPEDSNLSYYLQSVRCLVENQPIWDKQYLVLRVAEVIAGLID